MGIGQVLGDHHPRWDMCFDVMDGASVIREVELAWWSKSGDHCRVRDQQRRSLSEVKVR